MIAVSPPWEQQDRGVGHENLALLCIKVRSLTAPGIGVPRRDVSRLVALYRQGKPVDQLLTGRLCLDQINLGFDRLARGEAIRQVIMMEG